MKNDTWTPLRGLIRAVFGATVSAAALAGLLAGLIAAAPIVPLSFIPRVAIAFVVTSILFAVVHSCAGMVGGVCSFIAIVFAALVMASNHLAWAEFGIPIAAYPYVATGWEAGFSPLLLIVSSAAATIGIALGALLGHTGALSLASIGSFLSFRWTHW
ncbi:MAG: hypothetical protein KDA25_09810 [Phycisphaerales bacterium]|nr:hypothetical protein [Phycisphaerales bacterium]